MRSVTFYNVLLRLLRYATHPPYLVIFFATSELVSFASSAIQASPINPFTRLPSSSWMVPMPSGGGTCCRKSPILSLGTSQSSKSMAAHESLDKGEITAGLVMPLASVNAYSLQRSSVRGIKINKPPRAFRFRLQTSTPAVQNLLVEGGTLASFYKD
jgi:hypothetical protein